jgi:histidinol-phosphate aminotransferase
MKAIDEFIVPWIKDVEPYSDRHLEFAWQNPDVVRLMSNENPLPPSEAVIDAVVAAVRRSNLYPDSGHLLRQKLAENAGPGLTADNILLGNGSTEVLDIIIRTFIGPGDEAIIHVPTFTMYEARVRANGGVAVKVPMEPGFEFPVGGLLAAIGPRTKLIFICSPNNPTGNQISDADLRRVVAAGVPTIVDEAYYELEVEPRTRATWISDHPNVLVNRTFSKAFGLAGLRIGYAVASRDIVSYLNRMKIPWNVGLLPLAAGLAAVDDTDALKLRQSVNHQGRRQLCDAINQIQGLRAFASEGNFVLIDATSLGRSSRRIVEDLIASGVFVRPMAPHNLPDGYVRVTVGTSHQNETFLALLADYVAVAQSAKYQ